MDFLHPLRKQAKPPLAERPALTEAASGAVVNYSELAERVDKLSRQLADLSVFSAEPVAILANKRTHTVVALLGILDAGGAYVPLDANSTTARNVQICSELRPRYLLLEKNCDQALLESLDCVWRTLPCVEPQLTLIQCEWSSAPPQMAADLAVVLYTSGSTGTPKGVQLTRSNIQSFIDWAIGSLELPADAVCASIAPLHFDLSLFDLFVSLALGWNVVLCDQKTSQNPRLLALYLAQHRVSVCYSTPTLYTLLLRHGQIERHDLRALSHILFAGEVFNPVDLADLRRQMPEARFFNLYDPTETNVVAFHALPPTVGEGSSTHPPIGYACAHAHLMLLQENSITSPAAGRVGELLVAGDSVMSGYVAREQETAAALIVGPGGERYYRTGDIVSVGKGGEFTYLHRVDRMIKRRGYRIQPEELEAAILQHPAVAATAVFVEDSVRMTAYWVPRHQMALPSGSDLKRHCLDILPAWFMPDAFVMHDKLPVNSHGKIDRTALSQEVIVDGA